MTRDPMAQRAIGQWQKPMRWQRHDEYRNSRNRSSQNDHSIGGVALRERTDDWDQEQDEPIVDHQQMSDGCSFAEFAHSPFRKNPEQLSEDHLQACDQE